MSKKTHKEHQKSKSYMITAEKYIVTLITPPIEHIKACQTKQTCLERAARNAKDWKNVLKQSIKERTKIYRNQWHLLKKPPDGGV